MHTLAQQLIYFFAALLLLLNFGLLAQRRMLNLIRLLALQGLILSIDIAWVAYATFQPELYVTVALTLFLKVGLIPYILYRLLIRLGIRSKVEPILNLPTTLLIGLGLVIFAFNLSVPIAQLSAGPNSNTLALALASVLVSFFMMIIKRKAISQVMSLLALENSLFFFACSATYGMPLIVELGIAFDVLVGLFIFGIFFFRIRNAFEDFDLRHLEKLREE